MASAEDIGKLILAQAAQVPGATWSKIEQSTKLFVNGYAQNLLDIAQGVASGDIEPDEGKMNATNALFLFQMAIAHATQVTLNEVQKFINNLIGILKGAINAKLPFAIL